MKSWSVVAASVAGLVLCAGVSRAQCVGTTTLSLFDAYRSSPRPVTGEAQLPGTAWHFHRGSEDGPLLAGLSLGGLPCWGSPQAAYGIPVVGPVCSPTSGVNEWTAGRAATFNGVFAHPGNVPTEDNIIVFSAQGGGTLSSFQLQTELMGSISDGVQLSARVVRAGGGTVTLIPAQAVAQTSSSFTFDAAAGLFPLTLAPGDRVVVRSNQGGAPFEDWQNLDVRIGFSGPPVIVSQPHEQTQCAPTSAAFGVVARGNGSLSYQWMRDGLPLSNGATPWGSVISGAQGDHLMITGPTGADRGHYACSVTSPCGTTVSGAAYLSACQCIDFNNDSLFPDTADIDDFLTVFSGGPCSTGACSDIDFNADGLFPDTADIDAFLSVFSGGLCT
ncbi:MAG: immunoglobulin domain-containing protein [Phycisphaerales bacterium]